jgi:hypothetical protein
VIGLPPSEAGAVHETRAFESSADATTEVGASGTVPELAVTSMIAWATFQPV